MASIDDLFKKPVLPSQKRKLERIRDPNEVYKSPRLQDSSSVRAVGSQQPSAEDDVKEDGDEDTEAGPEMPPDFEEEEIGADEEGRFFGSGVSDQTADAIKYIDIADEEGDAGEDKIDVAWLRRTALSFERKINKNAELRARHENDPQKFMASEADLDTEIKALSLLSDHPQLYDEFAKLGCAGSLVGLLAHENTDIAIDACEIIGELIDDDTQAEEAHWNSLVDAFLEADLLDLLYSNFDRLNEEQEDDRKGVYNILAVLEVLASRASVAEMMVQNQVLLPWLLARTKRVEPRVTQNKQFAAEVCAVLLQTSSVCRARFIELDGIDALLQLLSAYRKRDPDKDSEEEEFMENLFDCLACATDERIGKLKFLEAEGIELCLIMLREGRMSKPRALRILDHTLSGAESGQCCEAFVAAAGLKPLFTALMKKQESRSYEHILGILASLLRQLPADSAPRVRLLAKFVEKDYQKITRIVELRSDYAVRIGRAEREITRERNSLSYEDRETMAPEWLSRRLDAGLFSLRTADTILAWIAAEDEGARTKVSESLSLDSVKASIREQADETDGDSRDMFVALADAM